MPTIGPRRFRASITSGKVAYRWFSLSLFAMGSESCMLLSNLRYYWAMNFGHIIFSFMKAAGRSLRLVAGTPALDNESSNGDRPQLDGSDLMGDYNFRTGRMDCGVDPYGWYEDDD